jgi:hypothetical protein
VQGEEGWRHLAADHAADLLNDETKVQGRLKLYAFLSRVAVILGIVAPILAGSTVLASYSKVDHWPVVGGVLTLLASAGVALHKGLDCERYHGKCHDALAELRSLATAYDCLLSDAQANDDKGGFAALEVRLDKFYKNYADVLPLRPTHLSQAPGGKVGIQREHVGAGSK